MRAAGLHDHSAWFVLSEWGVPGAQARMSHVHEVELVQVLCCNGCCLFAGVGALFAGSDFAAWTTHVTY